MRLLSDGHDEPIVASSATFGLGRFREAIVASCGGSFKNQGAGGVSDGLVIDEDQS